MQLLACEAADTGEKRARLRHVQGSGCLQPNVNDPHGVDAIIYRAAQKST
jgi:hypothetical protein